MQQTPAKRFIFTRKLPALMLLKPQEAEPSLFHQHIVLKFPNLESMALQCFRFMYLLFLSLVIVSSGNEYSGYSSQPKYHTPEVLVNPELRSPPREYGNPVTVPSPIHRTLASHQIPVTYPTPSNGEPIYRPKPQYKKPFHSKPVHKKPGYKKPFHYPRYAQPSPVHGTPYQSPTDWSPPIYSPPYQSSPDQSPPIYYPPDQSPPDQSPPVYSPPDQNPPDPSPPVYSPPDQSPPVYSPPDQSPPVYSPPDQSPPDYSPPSTENPPGSSPAPLAPPSISTPQSKEASAALTEGGLVATSFRRRCFFGVSNGGQQAVHLRVETLSCRGTSES